MSEAPAATPAAGQPAPAAPAAPEPAPQEQPAVPVQQPPAEQPPATPAVKPEQQPSSILDSADPNAAPAAQPAAPVAQEPPPANDAKWYYNPTTPGAGDPPDWFKGDKYVSVEEQAKAYVDLESRFGAFTGAPKDGVYAINPPEVDGVKLEFETDHPLFQELNKWAKENQFSQKGYDGLIDLFGRYEAGLAPNMNEIKKSLGENADARINSVNQWAKSNLKEDEYAAFRTATSDKNAAQVFQTFEALMALSRQPAMPAPAEDTTGGTPIGLAEINAMREVKTADGKFRIDVDPAYRAEIEQKTVQFFNSQKQK